MQDPNEETEWNDTLRKHGIIGEREKTEAEVAMQSAEDFIFEKAQNLSLAKAHVGETTSKEELDKLADEVDADDEEEARRKYREQRIAEMKAAAAKPQFGEVIDITGNEYIKEVNHAGKGVWVVLLLYNTGLIVCNRLKQVLATLACKHKGTKFVQSVAQNCIPNYPDKNLPTVFIYLEDDLKTQWVGPSIFGGENMTVADVEWALSQAGACETDMKQHPRQGPNTSAKAPFGISVSDRTKAMLEKEKNNSDSDSDDD
eukprot:m.21301 g.21301  ORF g.21301 m.21301 type:complete len:258 (-) comp13340_c0_seq1:256-1029(-)